MPGRNVVKNYVAGGVYHVYNRGVEKRTIFTDGEDYRVFLHFLGLYLRPGNQRQQETLPRGLSLAGSDYDLDTRIDLLAYCLMPNHFHLLLLQADERSMSELMRRQSNAYVGYFNKKHGRVGTLFQGRYRAALIDRTELLVHVSRYIHRNPTEVLARSRNARLDQYRYSSYPDYIGIRTTPWLRPSLVLEQFKAKDVDASRSYRDYVEGESEQTDDTPVSWYRLD